MHDRRVVVFYAEVGHSFGTKLAEVFQFVETDVLRKDSDERVSIVSLVLVNEANHVTELVGDDVFLQKEKKKEMFYLTTQSTHFIYGYMASDIIFGKGPLR